MKDVFSPYFKTKLCGYQGLATARAWDLSGSSNSVLFCGQFGCVVCYRWEGAWSGENHSTHGQCYSGYAIKDNIEIEQGRVSGKVQNDIQGHDQVQEFMEEPADYLACIEEEYWEVALLRGWWFSQVLRNPILDQRTPHTDIVPTST